MINFFGLVQCTPAWKNPTDGGAWWAAVHGITEGRTWLSNFTFTFHFAALEKEMAAHSSVLAWRIPGTGEPGGLLAMGSHRVGHNWSDLAAAAAAADWPLGGSRRRLEGGRKQVTRMCLPVSGQISRSGRVSSDYSFAGPLWLLTSDNMASSLDLSGPRDMNN